MKNQWNHSDKESIVRYLKIVNYHSICSGVVLQKLKNNKADIKKVDIFRVSSIFMHQTEIRRKESQWKDTKLKIFCKYKARMEQTQTSKSKQTKVFVAGAALLCSFNLSLL